MTLPPDLHTPAIDALKASLDEDADMLMALAHSTTAGVRAAAIRALGRAESREFTATILLHLANGPASEVATALAQSLRGEPLALDTSGEQVQRVLDDLIKAGQATLYRIGPDRYVAIDAIARAIGRLPYVRADQAEAAEAFLLLAMRRADDDPVGRVYMPGITRAMETFARVNVTVAPVTPVAVDWLRRVATSSRRYAPAARVNALAALIAARGVDADTLRAVVTSGDAELTRLGVTALAGSGSPIDEDERARLLSTLLSDPSMIVRIEAVRGWARTASRTNGCGRLLDVLRDPATPVVLAAIDALGDACRDDQDVTGWLTADLRTPPEIAWHRASHALVAMAKRAPDRAAIAMAGHVGHTVWQVRLYAARAAAIMHDVVSLERLGYDADSNVREVTLAPLRRLKGAGADPFFVSALAKENYELLRTAAVELKGASSTPALVAALADALTRVTLEKKETSRDLRLALLARLDELGGADQAAVLMPLLQDFDVPVAMAAASMLERWTGKPQDVAPQLLARPTPPRPAEIEEATKQVARLEFKSGKILYLRLAPHAAPLMSVRFLRLVKAGYYNGLTFHRTVANFVVQGGSPGANEYDGDGPYVRDEISLLGNTRGSVGLSARGRDTGDAQFYFNLVDNPRLDYGYTVFGRVAPLAVMDGILEGDTIASITFEKRPKGLDINPQN